MLTEYALAKTWFPGTRKELIIESIKLLETRAGEKRIQVAFAMPLSDGKQVGMPDRIGQAFDVIAKQDSTIKNVQFEETIKEMAYSMFHTEDSQKVAQTASVPLMANISVSRDGADKEESLAGISCYFTAYFSASLELWKWFYGYHRMRIFVKFETTQKELFDQPKEDTQMKLVEGGDYEDQRRDATSKARDAEFAQA